MNNSHNRLGQSGFTLVEIAVVLVIIGLLLGGALKGAELIDNSRVKSAITDINGIAAARNAYIDRYKRLPGDDGNTAALRRRGGEWATNTGLRGGNGNGILAISAAQTFSNGGEQAAFWQHLRTSGLLTGDSAATGREALPRNAFGGLMGVTTETVQGSLRGTKVCMNGISGKAAIALDNQIDDGVADTGDMRATADAQGNTPTAPAAGVLGADYDEGAVYVICSKI